MPEVAAVWVRFSGAVFGLDSDVFLAGVYLPPAASQQLQRSPLSQRMADLHASQKGAQAIGHVWLAGDLNAKAGALQDFTLDTSAWLKDTGLWMVSQTCIANCLFTCA